MAERIITHIAINCQSSVSSFLDAIKLQHHSVRDFVSERDVKHIQERYDQWAGNLGALQPAQSRMSLEHRLCNSLVVREAILEKLENLNSSLQAGKGLCTSLPFFLKTEHRQQYISLGAAALTELFRPSLLLKQISRNMIFRRVTPTRLHRLHSVLAAAATRKSAA